MSACNPVTSRSPFHRILITGGAGFIGSNLIRLLRSAWSHTEIIIYDNFSAGTRYNTEDPFFKKDPALRICEDDIMNLHALIEHTRGVDAVIHLAAFTNVVESVAQPELNFNINLGGLHNILEACRINNVSIFVFASSNAAAGKAHNPINEKAVPRPMSVYGAAKLAGEGLCSAYFHSYGLKTVSLRFANAYGLYSEHKNSVIAKFIKRLHYGQDLEIFGDGRQTRDFIDARDIARGIYRSLVTMSDTSRSDVAGEVFQIATGRETSVMELTGLLLRVFPSATSHRVCHLGKRAGEIEKNFSDISKARNTLMFAPAIQLKNGLQFLIDNFRFQYINTS